MTDPTDAQLPAEGSEWPRAAAWLAGDHHPHPVARLAVLGAPLHRRSLTSGRCDLAPAAIRDGLRRFSTWAGGDDDVRAVAADDLGDLPLAARTPEEARTPVADAVADALGGRNAVAILGGDNSISRLGVLGLGVPLSRVGLLTLDAHFDLRDTGGGLTNGNPVRALLEDGLPGPNISQIGIQPFANSPIHARAAQEAGIEVVTADEVRARGVAACVTASLRRLAERAEVVYVDLDLDVLDRAAAPGTPGSRPGGLQPAEVLVAAAAAGANPIVRAIDLVEVDPTRDVGDATVLAGAACLLRFAAGLTRRGRGGDR